MKRMKSNSSEYEWGEKCRGWHLLNQENLSVIQEIMPPGTQEVMHKHEKSQQFFFILRGEATFIIEGKTYKIGEQEGIYIKPRIVHQIKNETTIDLELLVISHPHSHGDRILIE